MNRMGKASEAWDFADVDSFWEGYKPLTPWGKDEAQTKTVLSERKLIEERYDDIEAAMAFMIGKADDTSVLERVSHHLRRMPRLSLEQLDPARHPVYLHHLQQVAVDGLDAFGRIEVHDGHDQQCGYKYHLGAPLAEPYHGDDHEDDAGCGQYGVDTWLKHAVQGFFKSSKYAQESAHQHP